MQLSLQPFTTAGIALVGASAIALSPLAPPPVTTSATTPVSTAAVQLSAAVDPLTRWGQVIEASAANLNELADYYMDRPLPIATEVFKNVQTYADILASGFQAGAMNLQNWANTIMGPAIQKAAGELSAGNIELAAKTFTSALGQVIFQLTPMMSMLTIPQTVNDHIHAVVDEIFQITTLSTPVGLPITLINDTIRSLASSMQGSVDAFEAGDIPTAMAAIANAPAELATALLNDRGGLIDFERRGSAGTLITGGAVLNMLIKLPRRIADKLVIPPTTAAATGAPLAISGPSTPELPTVGGPAIDLAPSPAPDTAATGAAEPDKGDTLPTGRRFYWRHRSFGSQQGRGRDRQSPLRAAREDLAAKRRRQSRRAHQEAEHRHREVRQEGQRQHRQGRQEKDGRRERQQRKRIGQSRHRQRRLIRSRKVALAQPGEGHLRLNRGFQSLLSRNPRFRARHRRRA
ncbi:hypothetical protein [Mycolicibacterium farcinogenes]|uniref:Uncharacterized protein n=1 Tax=Mycolicibacterium farcinogenes TaxID=1802 RepID=A0ACD1FKI4_MYCFR|nr:hypothetical protein [Mycolicibacterium farcinogenes]QZH67551.1 hypothetical protein K6L26_07900 [Mycolicibacterium farcinogenes]